MKGRVPNRSIFWAGDPSMYEQRSGGRGGWGCPQTSSTVTRRGVCHNNNNNNKNDNASSPFSPHGPWVMKEACNKTQGTMAKTHQDEFSGSVRVSCAWRKKTRTGTQQLMCFELRPMQRREKRNHSDISYSHVSCNT